MTYTLNTVGRFNMIFYDGSNNIVDNATYTVHPTYTEWKANPVNTDWNEWNNWTAGSPYCCTDVVINGDAAKYPLLPATVTEADEYCCDMIHLRHDTFQAALGSRLSDKPQLHQSVGGNGA